MTVFAFISSGKSRRQRRGSAAIRVRVALVIALALAGSIGMAAPAWADDRSPLLMEGKRTLYQRVLTRPGAILHASPADNAPTVGAGLPPLSIFFVYDRRKAGDTEWLEIGAASRGVNTGWIKADTAIDWRQTLTVTFTPPIKRERALFFRDQRDLAATVKSADPGSVARRYLSDINIRSLPPDGPIVSVEPDKPVDMLKNFYLLPILYHADTRFKTGFPTKLLQVAAENPAPLPPDCPGPKCRVYKIGVVFVIDTTISMQRYIERTRQAVRRIYEALAGSSSGNKLAFGLVGFRDNISVRPKLEYVTRKFSELADAGSKDTFLRMFDQARSAEVSNKGVSADSYAGVHEAIDKIEWKDYEGRFVVLITDASARRANDPLSATRLDAAELNRLAREKHIAIVALHLQTPLGKKSNDIDTAREQYTSLASFPGVGSLYNGIDIQKDADFGRRIDGIAEGVARQIKNFIDETKTGQEQTPAPPRDELSSEEPDEFQRKVDQVGRAMQLAYLGSVAGTQAPRMFEAWVADRDFADPKTKSLEVRVLINKKQLSDLQETLEKILKAGESSRLKPGDFFEQLRAAAATLSRAPEAVNENTVKRIADLGLQAEYLQDLPYQSKLMALTQDDWLSWGFGQQREFLDELESKLKSYQEFHDHTDLWVALDKKRQVAGDEVYQIPLDALP